MCERDVLAGAVLKIAAERVPRDAAFGKKLQRVLLEKHIRVHPGRFVGAIFLASLFLATFTSPEGAYVYFRKKQFLP